MRRAPYLPKRFRWSVICGLVLVADLQTQPATAEAARDRKVQREISRVISRQYLRMQFDDAENRLLEIVEACRDKCRASTVAKAWMYVGVVRGSGKEDQASARKAFDAAVAADPRVRLDDALATPETRVSYEAARDGRGGSEDAPPSPGLAPGGTKEGGDEPRSERSRAAGLSCTPDVREVQTRRPIPVECRGDAEEVRFSLRYQEPSGAWTTLGMTRRGDAFRAQIPCAATMDAGSLDYYVIASDTAGEPVETFGSKSAPERFTVDPRSQAAPRFPGEAAPARCAEPVLCPPDFPGCDDNMGDEEPVAEPYATNWFGIHLAADFGFIGGSDVCSTHNEEFECFASGADDPYPEQLPSTVAGAPGELGDPYPGTGIRTGASVGTLRALLSLDHAISSRLSVGARLGCAFGGGPGAIDGRSFLPFHAEGRVQYWLRGLGSSGVRPYLHLGGGLAQVDIRKEDVTVRDCSQETARQAFLDCIGARNDYAPVNAPELPTRTLDSYRKLGNAFVTTGGGVQLPLGRAVNLQVNLNAMLMMPSTGFVLQPSIGLGYEL